MTEQERRREARHSVDAPGELFLSEGRCIPVRIVNLGRLGALLAIADLEEAVLEGERVVLGHPGAPSEAAAEEEASREDAPDGWTRTAGAVVRVDLDFSESGVLRHLAVYFDGGAAPKGCTAQLS